MQKTITRIITNTVKHGGNETVVCINLVGGKHSKGDGNYWTFTEHILKLSPEQGPPLSSHFYKTDIKAASCMRNRLRWGNNLDMCQHWDLSPFPNTCSFSSQLPWKAQNLDVTSVAVRKPRDQNYTLLSCFKLEGSWLRCCYMESRESWQPHSQFTTPLSPWTCVSFRKF